MTAAPPPDELPDDITAAYRQASERDAARPGAQVRSAILNAAAAAAHVRRTVPETGGIDHWKWKAAASIAVAGLIGVLVSQIFRVPTTVPPVPAAAVAPAGVPATIPPAPAESYAEPSAPLPVPATASHGAARQNSPATPGRAPQPLHSVARSQTSLNEVVVDARRVEEQLQDVPISMSAFPDSVAPMKQPRAPDLTDSLPATDRSIVGRPAAVAAEVAAHCGHPSSLTQLVDCHKIHVLLRQFSLEPRETPWAPQTEEQLRGRITSDPTARELSVHALECRTKHCVVELAAPERVQPDLAPASLSPPGKQAVVALTGPQLHWTEADAFERHTLTVAIYARK